MSIFKETFPDFVTKELTRRQDGMLTRTPAFLHQLNTRASWVRLTSGVNYSGNNNLAKQYVLQGGTLLNGTSLRAGLGGDGTSSYDLSSPGGVKHRMGIRPMPGITDVNIQSKGAYGSLQEATVSFIAWDIKQLEDLEILYMRPGYTVLLEFGWSFVNPMPKYNILDLANNTGVSLNDAFKDIYKLIQDSNGNYDALLGYVKNYNWSARPDGGYDCTTTIISLGEVLESLKCNWVPMETAAFSKNGLLGYGPEQGNDVGPSYETGIIPGLLRELFFYMDQKANPLKGSLNYSRTFKDPNFPNSTYNLYMSKRLGKDIDKIDRGGLPKVLGSARVEGYITLASFCELINNYVLLKDGNDNSLSQITTNEIDESGNLTDIPLKCIASPLSLSTNYGICFVRNDNWKSLGVKDASSESEDDKKLTSTLVTTVPADVQDAIQRRDLIPLSVSRIRDKIKEISPDTPLVPGNIPIITSLLSPSFYIYTGDIETDLNQIAKDIFSAIVNVEIKAENKLVPKFIFNGGRAFFSSNTTSSASSVNFFDYFYKVNSNYYIDLFGDNYPIQDNKKSYTRGELQTLVNKIFTQYPLNALQSNITNQLPEVAGALTNIASNVPGLTSETLQFLVSDATANTKSLGYLGNIYVNMDFLYSQAVSKNVASNDVQNKNTISIRDYMQSILRNIQNSLGNINNFDLQVDNRNAIGRIIDISYTGDPAVNLFTLQIHNLNSTVRTYNFQSKIFPEMGSIIAISAQDATGIGKLGYDNATLVAWNDNITDRLIPKKSFTSAINVDANANDIAKSSPTSFLFPFLTKLYPYFEALDGKGLNNPNLSYGGLDFAYRDFLANLDRYDPQNQFKSIIPTELSITLDGIGGMIIGNLFQINQDIVPKGYKSVKGRNLAYIVTKLGHSIENNDWTTTLQAYPIILENTVSTNVWKEWNKNEYPNSISLTAGGTNIYLKGSFATSASKLASFGKISNAVPLGIRPLLDVIAYTEGVAAVGQNGYDVIVGNRLIPNWTSNYAEGHPNISVVIQKINDTSTAAGRYQVLKGTWDQYAGDIPFNQANQDVVAYKLLKDKRNYSSKEATNAFLAAQKQISANNIDVKSNPDFLAFLDKSYAEWASLPNANGEYRYSNQGGEYTPADVYQIYIDAVKKYSR